MHSVTDFGDSDNCSVISSSSSVAAAAAAADFTKLKHEDNSDSSDQRL